MKNEFKFSTLRQFGSENVSFTATIHSDNEILSENQIEDYVKQVDSLIRKAFISVQEREISEKAILSEASARRRAEVQKLDTELKAEMKAKKEAWSTMKDAEKLSDKLSKKHA